MFFYILGKGSGFLLRKGDKGFRGTSDGIAGNGGKRAMISG